MPDEEAPMTEAELGDKIVVRGHYRGEARKEAEILAVEGEHGEPPYRVRWEQDGHEGLFFPGPDALIVHYHHQSARKDATAAKRRAAQRGGREKRP